MVLNKFSKNDLDLRFDFDLDYTPHHTFNYVRVITTQDGFVAYSCIDIFDKHGNLVEFLIYSYAEKCGEKEIFLSQEHLAHTYEEAKNYCLSLGSNWNLPKPSELKELRTVTEHESLIFFSSNIEEMIFGSDGFLKPIKSDTSYYNWPKKVLCIRN